MMMNIRIHHQIILPQPCFAPTPPACLKGERPPVRIGTSTQPERAREQMEHYKNKNQPPAQANGGGGSDSPTCCSKITKCLATPFVLGVINVVNSILIFLTGVMFFIGLQKAQPNKLMQQALCGLYTVCAGLIFLTFSVGGGHWVDLWNRKNCGFIYTFYGRMLFILFAGSLCFALPSNDAKDATASSSMAVGASFYGSIVGYFTWANGFFNMWIICMMPEYSANIGEGAVSTKQASKPTAGPGSFQPPKQSDVRAPNEVPADAFGSNDSSWAPPSNQSAFGSGNSGEDNPFS